ncbi:MAG: hypothetical protein C5B48_01985 [Candidatus Rokuibacteriota bacterium]|nr:MAG: hypothetical protein C5B48_01985 [Candidatus Rokubacteria bacterium]
MKLLPALAAVVCAAAAASASAPAAPRARTVFYDGDSLAVGTLLFLPSDLHGWSLRRSVSVSRHAYDGVVPVQDRGSALERVLVVDLGTNDDPTQVSRFGRAVRQILAAAGPDRCVIWATIHRPPYHGISWAAYNRTLRSLAARYDTLHVFDWAAMARAHPSWFGADGVHPNVSGYKARAAALARLIKGC